MLKNKLTKELLNELFEYKNGFLYRRKSERGQRYVGKQAGTLRKDGYYSVRVNGSVYLAHRLIFLMHHGYLPEMIDHIDGNPSNNLITNLREATNQQNQFNSKLHVNNKSGVRGVSWHKQKQKWRVRFTVNRKEIYIGSFDSLELAELVANEARSKYHKEYKRD